ncbi:hypothetical protein COCMIDRAFT_86108 [Bipolaris oryzae ATCC 44560]|uniref:Uncharacterized protein n=1 Tax=Bipolaris oryzae ATCC 44560 TaxID=930090 RepID=W6ZMW9_COCMI|nr:uncharacterized protein COCMIDRAFT_86108 [Bipolaris oryzae ATCC 44560]EUC48854.1 hypothetical protein COCMIDRAFT_86108 [Bipolaris oryzae ATCC 44560]
MPRSFVIKLTRSSVAFRHATRNYTQNTHNSPLYALPYEIIQHIGKFLGYADRFCFALTSFKYVDALLAICKPQAAKQSHIKDIRARIRRDLFYGHHCCSSARIGRRLGMMYCVGCNSPHASFRFPEDTVAQPLHLRRCFRATDGPFFMCQHNEFTFLEMSRMLQKNARKGRQNKFGDFFHCIECYELPYQRRRPGRCLHPPTLSLAHQTHVVTLRSRFLLLTVPWTVPVSVQQTKEALALLNLKICPHMTACDAEVIEGIVGDHQDIIMDGRFSKRISIDCDTCQTTFSIKRRVPFHEVVVEVERRLGQVKREADPIWRAHLPSRKAGTS